MPTQTFWNLPEAKRDAVMAIAIEEFATHDYASASVSRIVAQAGIAKGSLYQYFANKHDLFLYVVDMAGRTLLQAVQHDPVPAPDANFFQRLRWQMSASVRAALAYPLHAQVVRRAYTSALPFQDELLAVARELRQEHMRRLIAEGVARGDIDSALDHEVVVVMVSAVIADLGSLLATIVDSAQANAGDVAVFNSPNVERVYDQVIAVLEHGLRPRSATEASAA